MLCSPSEVNLKILPQAAGSGISPLQLNPDANRFCDRFCADALEQIKITAHKHATLLNNCPTRPRADLNFVSVSFVFMIASLFCFSLVSLVFTEVLEKIRREVTRKLGRGRRAVEAAVPAAKRRALQDAGDTPVTTVVTSAQSPHPRRRTIWGLNRRKTCGSSRLLFLAKFLESGVSGQSVPDLTRLLLVRPDLLRT
jgi:hypothetical protein